ncbi:MAG: ABC transporter ATP-binding protein [Gammaproteobacteria bacterium]|nr:ABC transporter ATP-binding protein [Gammaproteobacteria bacterium]MCP4879284.1 ABC transporter ATP-binding protein [Gammaproteobacteria bacterium]MDP6165100.1 ABC transporter ATP-binding protein [Gammaproteobacteria bacterium]
MALLEINNVSKHFGGLAALDEVSFSALEGEIHGLIGPNGAGKSTMFKNISGFYSPTTGTIRFNGQDIQGLSPSSIAKLGIVRTFQETTLFQELTVFENVLVGCHLEAEVNLLDALFGLNKKVQQKANVHALKVLDFMGLTERKDQLAIELPLGSQRALAIAIALAAKPKLILMDEPFAGMNPEETRQMMDLTRKVNETGVTIVLVEHDMKAVMGLCENITVLNFGTLLAQGKPDEIRQNDKVINAYLGGGH